MLIQRIGAYLGRMHEEIPSIDGRPKLLLYIDFLWCFFRYGTVLDQYIRGRFYRLNNKQRSRSVTYRRICQIYKASINNEYVPLLQNKIDFNRHFSTLIKRKWLSCEEMSFDDFKFLCNGIDELIVKPTDESEGKGIFKLKVSAFNQINAAYENLKGKKMIAEELLHSHRDLCLGSTSLNTIRVHSIIDQDNQVHFVKFILRAGVGETVVDNYCAGGCIYEVSENNGTIISQSYSKVHPQSDFHPGTDIKMPGRQIPYWNEVKELIIKAHRMLPQIKFIGWDVAVTDNGPELIEGNHHPDYDLLEFVGTRFWWPVFKKYLNIRL